MSNFDKAYCKADAKRGNNAVRDQKSGERRNSIAQGVAKSNERAKDEGKVANYV